ncbi:CAP domain-containing protein [Mycena floridula]|nr:CAP domain-containing protein [Mycena floridula]
MLFASYTLLALAGFFSFVSAGRSRMHRRGVGSQYIHNKQVIAAFLDAHNEIRQAHDAVDLTWSDTLAEKADLWASNCVWSNTNGVLLNEPYGENMVAASGHISIEQAVNAFTQDENQYNPNKPVYNHFTQVVWKSTTEVGCAVSQCSNIFQDSNAATYIVCLYNPPGNIIGQTSDNVQP